MGIVVLDAGPVIAVLDESDPHHQVATRAFQRVLEQGHDFVLPATAYAETMVGPFRGGSEAVRIVDLFLADVPVDIEPANHSHSRWAARLQAMYGSKLRLPDALVVATAANLGAEQILTTDARWPDFEMFDLRVEVV